MFETDMPAKRQFNVFPSPEGVVKFGFRAVRYLIMAGILFGTAWWLAPPSLWHLFSGSTEVQANTRPAAPHVTNAVDRHDQSVEEYADDRVFSAKLQLCQSMKLVFDGKTCQKPPPPAAWSGEGITGKPPMRLHEAQEKLAEAAEAEPEETERPVRRMVDENERRPPRMADSGPQPGLRLRHQSPRDCREGQYWDPDAWFGMGGCLYDHGER